MSEYQSEVYDVCGGFEARDLTDTLNVLVRSITEIMRVKGSSIRLLDENTNSLRVAAAHGLSKSYVDKGPLMLAEVSVEKEILGEDRQHPGRDEGAGGGIPRRGRTRRHQIHTERSTHGGRARDRNCPGLHGRGP